jgi:hypothetical protein
MRHYPFDVSHLVGPSQHSGQPVDQEVKEDVGKWVTLPHSPDVMEEIPNFSVAVNRSLATRNQLHQTMDHHTCESFVM